MKDDVLYIVEQGGTLRIIPTSKSRGKTGERVFLPFQRPYCVVEITSNDACMRRVDRPQDEPILVALYQLRRCPEEFPNEFWPPDKKN